MASSMQELVPEKTATLGRHFRHIRELDGVRGIAALMVLFHHLCFTSIQPMGWNAPVRALYNIFRYGSSGVDLFFVLSGFLITSLLIQARTSPSYYQDFYWKRALRILPLYILCLLCVLLFMPGSRDYVILSALFISNFASVVHVTVDGPFWTLAIEEQFYLIWPTVVRRRSVAQLRRWAWTIGLAPIGLRLFAAGFGHYNYHLTFLHCDGLAFGAYLACWFSQRDPSTPNSLRERRAIGIAFIAGVVFTALSFLPATDLKRFALLSACGQTGVTFLCGSTIAYLISHAGRRHLALLRSPALTFFGLISYAMYMIHLYVMLAYDSYIGAPPTGNNLAYITRVFAILAITIALCLLTRYLIELPAISLRKYVLSRPRA